MPHRPVIGSKVSARLEGGSNAPAHHAKSVLSGFGAPLVPRGGSAAARRCRALVAATVCVLGNMTIAAERTGAETAATSALINCSQQHKSVAKAKSQFEATGWRVATEQEAGRFIIDRGDISILNMWASGRLPMFASALARTRGIDLAEFKSMSEQEKATVLLFHDPKDVESAWSNPVTKNRAIFARSNGDSSMLIFSFRDNRGWKQHCKLHSPVTDQSARELEELFGVKRPWGQTRKSEEKVTLPPLSNDPKAVSPRATITMLNTGLIRATLNTEARFPVQIATELSVAPPATSPADEANQ